MEILDELFQSGILVITHRRSEMKVQVVIAGFNRCLSVTYPIINKLVIKALQDDGVKVRVDLIISRTKKQVINPRSHEIGKPEWRIPTFTKDHTCRTYNASIIDWRAKKMYSWAKSLGDPWPESNFKNLRNVVGQLKMLHIAARHIDKASDAILYLRPDLIPLDRFTISRYENRLQLASIFPYWHSWGGLNDRVALLRQEDAHIYFNRLLAAPQYLSQGQMLHAEKFMGFAMRESKVEQVMLERFTRARIGGVLQSENFEHGLTPEMLIDLGVEPGTNGNFLARSEGLEPPTF